MSYNKVSKKYLPQTAVLKTLYKKKYIYIYIYRLYLRPGKIFITLGRKSVLWIFSRLTSFCLWNKTYFSLSRSPCCQVSSFQNWSSFDILHSVSSSTKQWVINTNIYYLNTEIFISIEIIQLQHWLLFFSYYCLFIWWHI